MPSVIHIGANKTGSTTLQRCLFTKHNDLSYLGEDCVGFETYKNMLNSLVSDDDVHYCSKAVQELFSRFADAGEKKVFIYSNEDIMTSRLPTQCAKRLYELLPDAEILVVLRNQLTAIPSIYVNHGAYLKMVPRSFWRQYVSFDDWMAYCTEFIRYSYLDSFFYHRILNLYASLFGKDKIHILFYEEFTKTPHILIEKLCNILKIDSPEAIKLLEGKRERQRNTMRMFRYHKFRSSFLWGVPLMQYVPFGEYFSKLWWAFLKNGEPASGFMTDFWKKQIVDLYKTDNTKLAQEYNLPLKDYGYPLE